MKQKKVDCTTTVPGTGSLSTVVISPLKHSPLPNRSNMRHFRRTVSLPSVLFLLVQLLGIPTALASSSSPNWKGAPWQSSGGDNSESLLEQLRYNELSPTIFSPTGRLHPVERTMEQVRQVDGRSNLVVALHCQDGMLMLSTVPLSPYLNTSIIPMNNSGTDAATATTTTASLFLVQNENSDIGCEVGTTTLPIVDLTPGIIGAAAGKVLDCQVLRLRMQALVQQLMEDDLDQATKSDGILVSKVARLLADQLQVPTQKTTARQGPLLASAAVILGHRQLWRIDPTGQFWNCHAVVAGRESDRAEEALVTKLLERMGADENAVNELGPFLKSSLTCDDALDLVCECLQTVFWPESLNLKGLPEGVRATIPAIPWVAVMLREGSAKSLTTTTATTRQIRRGAFLPPLFTDTKQEEQTVGKNE